MDNQGADLLNNIVTQPELTPELETQIEIVRRLPFGSNLDFKKVDILLEEVMKMLNVMIFNNGL